MGFESFAHVTPGAALALRQMQGEVITGEWILVLVNLHIERIFGIGIRIQKERDINIINLSIKFGLPPSRSLMKFFKTETSADS